MVSGRPSPSFSIVEEVNKVGKKHQAEIPPMMSISNYCKVQKNPHYLNPLKELAIPLTLGHGIHENRGKSHYLVPGHFSNPSWDKKEEDIFILGLYIFGKDFVKVKKFIGRYKTMREMLSYKVKKFIGNEKTMGEILSFYYKKLCNSMEHRRWKRWRQKPKKLESLTRVFGENIFQQPSRMKLLSRLKHMVSIECYGSILEVIWLYEESKVKTFEECIFKLMQYVELNTLVEAIGIGKGKKDLTAINAYEYTNVRKVSNGKDCSMLTHREIVTILSSFTLSKHRSKNLFWEAVWPRLLARGWHYEKQQGSHKYATKIFFFAPGVEHFSKKLEKWNHYFDSIGDVLEMVSLNPEMIELPTVEVARNYGLGEAMNLDRGNLVRGNFHCNHNLQVPNYSAKTKASTGGNDTNGKKLVIGEEVMPCYVNTKITNTRARLQTTKMLEALESEEYHPTIENRKRKNSPHGSSVPMSSGYTRAKLAGESSQDNARGY